MANGKKKATKRLVKKNINIQQEKKSNSNLQIAKKAKYDEFYTLLVDIEKQMSYILDYDPNIFENKTILCPCDDAQWSNFFIWFAQNFQRIKAKKIIGTSYNPNGKGKLYFIDRDINNDGRVDHKDYQVQLMDGDGDFRSQEVKLLRDNADFIVTNPPFSLFRDFIAWIFEANKKFLILGPNGAITYKEVFPLIKDNKIWLGIGVVKKFLVPDNYPKNNFDFGSDGKKYVSFGNIYWFTNINHNKRNEILGLLTKERNLKYKKYVDSYPRYDNFKAIEVSEVKGIPSNYLGVMGVPVSFLEKYNPNQFEIIGNEYSLGITKGRVYINGKRLYSRIFIKHKNKQ